MVFNSDPESQVPAISIRNLRLHYGGGLFRGKKVQVMDGLSLEAPRGSIYGLLGPSGCGKTSLIRCVLGSTKPNSGWVEVFGSRPGSARCSVPGPGVGYMPQEITLYDDLTIGETLHYFASLYGLGQEEGAKRCDFLVSFLNLPNFDRLVNVLSSGQKRRVSLAVALIHKPPLLVLDEPTVGVDPLLRTSIWAYLTELSKNEGLTVLITTHYIEEARDANLVGFMRSGTILEQGEPGQLLTKYGFDSLERVFLHLCTSEEMKKKHQKMFDETGFVGQRDSKKKSPTPAPVDLVPIVEYEQKLNLYVPPKLANPFSMTASMVVKNVRTIYRSKGYLVFQFALPVIQATLLCTCLGLDLHSVPLAVYDGDNSSLSRALTSELGSHRTLTVNMYPTENASLNAVRDGSNAAGLVIHEGFYDSLSIRLAHMMDVANEMNITVTDEIVKNSTIKLYPDMTNQLMVELIFKEVLETFQLVGKRTLKDAHINSSLLELPIQMTSPIYGDINAPFLDFIAPGFVIITSFFGAISLTTMRLVIERKLGLIERNIVAGVSNFRLLFAYLITNTVIIVGQVAIILAMILAVFGVPYHGNLAWIAALTFFQAISGMCFGLMISAMARDENSATMIALGALFPTLMLSGSIWPSEAMSDPLKYFSFTLPTTIPIRSMRCLMTRGWGLMHWEVYIGFAVAIAWISIFLFVSAMLLKYVRK